MRKPELNDPYYQKEAKRMVDMFFDNRLFNEKLTRDDLQSVEDLIAFYLDSTAKTTKKAADIMNRVRK